MGRGEDKMLVHMTPGEVGGLQQLAMAHGGSLTINPQTGLPEAGFLSKLLPTILGIAGAAFGLPTWAIGLGVGAGQTALTGDLGKGLSAGLQAFGGAGIGQAAGLGGQLGSLGKDIGLTQSMTGGVAANAPTADAVKAIVKSNDMRGLATAGANVAQKAPGFLGKFGAETALGQTGMLGKALPMMAGSAVLGGVSDAFQPKLPTYKEEDDGFNYEGPYVPGARKASFQPYDEMKRTGGAEGTYFTPSNPVPGYRPIASLSPDEQQEYGFAEGGLAEIPTPAGFNELVSFFGASSPGAVTASMYPTGVAPSTPTARLTGSNSPGEQVHESTKRPPTIIPPVPDRGPNYGGPGTGMIGLPGSSDLNLTDILAQIGYAPKDGSPATTPIPNRDIAYAPSTDLYRAGMEVPDTIISNPNMLDMGDGLYYTTPSLNIQPPSQLYDMVDSYDQQRDYSFADGGMAQTPTGFNDAVSFFGSNNPGAITASMYPTGATPSAPIAQPIGSNPPREQTYNFANRPPPTTAPVNNPYADYGYMDVPGVGNIMIPGFSQYDFSNIDWDTIARQQNYIPKAEQLVVREPDMSGIYDRFGQIENQLRNMPTTDLTGVFDRIGGIENQLQNLPATDFSGVYDRIGGIENQLQNLPTTDFSGVLDRIGGVENQLRNLPPADFSSVLDRIGGVENQLQNLPTTDFSGVLDRIGGVENQLRNLPPADFSGVFDRIGGIENQLRNLPPADFSSVLDRIGGVENQLQNIPTTDLTGIYDRFGSIENQLRGMPTYQEPDLSGIYDRFGSIENRLQNIPTTDLTGVYDRFGQIENQLQNLPTPQAPDLTGVFDRFGQLESRINSLPTPQATDLSGVYDRFGQLEGRLNSLPTPQAPDLSGIYDRFGQLEGRINSLPTPQATDLSGVYDRFGQLEGRLNSLPTPQATDLSGVYDRFGQLEGRLNSLPTPQATDLSGIQSQIEALRGQYQPTDLSGIQSQIEALRGQYQPTDLSGIQSQIETLGGRISNLPTPQATDLSGIQSQIEALRGQYQPTDLSGIQSQIEALRGQYQPTDLSGVQSQIEALRGQVGSMPAPQATDLSGIYDRFGQLEGRLNSLPTPQATDLSGIQSQIEALRGQVGSIPAPQATDLSGIQSQIEALRGQYQPTDLSGIQSQIEALRGQVGNMPAPQATDLSGIQSQIEALRGQVGSIPAPQATDLSGIQSQIEALRGQYQPTDLSGIQSQIAALQGQVGNIPAPQATDLSGIQSQIAALQGQYQPTDLSGVMAELQALRDMYSGLSNVQGGTGGTPTTISDGGFYAKGGAVDMADGAFVVDARTVSELGNGSSNAGMELLSRMGGRPLHGPGDGVSDSIPARIGGKQEARVARDEVIFQPDAVKRIGGGSEQRGTAKLYNLMDRAHKARKKAKRGQDTGLRRGLA
jgi:hypothetical protein